MQNRLGSWFAEEVDEGRFVIYSVALVALGELSLPGLVSGSLWAGSLFCHLPVDVPRPKGAACVSQSPSSETGQGTRRPSSTGLSTPRAQVFPQLMWPEYCWRLAGGQPPLPAERVRTLQAVSGWFQ